MGGGHERPWWLRLDGVSPSYERRMRARWPDWDHLGRDERLRREMDWQRRRQRDWLARHPVLVLVVGPLFDIWILFNLITTLLDATAHPAEVAYQVVITVVALGSSAWWLREFQRGRRGE